MNRSLALADQIYRFLLCSYPKGFRRKYGAEMASVFADTCRDTHQRSGMTGVVALWFATAGDWIVSVCAEQAAECATALKWDCRVLSDRPGFAAAAGAVLSILIFVLRVMLTGGLAESLRERFLLFAITSVHVAMLWAASVFVLHIAQRSVRTGSLCSSVFLERVRAFRHLASIALLLLLCPTTTILIGAGAASSRYGFLRPLPTLAHWLIGPLVLLAIVLGFFVIEPLLTMQSRTPRQSPGAFGGLVGKPWM